VAHDSNATASSFASAKRELGLWGKQWQAQFNIIAALPIG
jgi:hypothetical protein